MSTRDRLVATMATSMRERGLGSSAISDVLDRAEATAGSMYHFFPGGKEQLAAEAIIRSGAIGHQVLVDSLDAADGAADGVAEFFERLIEDLESSRFRLGCPIGVPTGEAAGANEAVREAGRSVFDSWAATIATALEDEGWEAATAAATAKVCVALYEGASLVARADADSAVVRHSIVAVRRALTQPT